MRHPLLATLLLSLGAATCASPAPPPAEVVVPAQTPGREAITAVLDDFHDAAAHADEARYFGHLAEGAVFLGTDATERWDVAAFRAYAHPRFAAGKAWSFKPVRREVTVDPGGAIAWFDEDLATPNLGPARGSGVLTRQGGEWKIAQYNLAITVQNDRFEAVKRAAAGIAPPVCPAPGTGVRGVVTFSGQPPKMKAPARRKDAEVCKTKDIPHNAVIVKGGRLADVLVRIRNGGVQGRFVVPTPPATIAHLDCTYAPRVVGVMVGQEIAIVNRDATLHNVHTYRGTDSWFNRPQIKGGEPVVTRLEAPGVTKVACDVHPWERGFVVASDHPFFAVTREDGTFHLDGVPPGKYRLEAWHSMFGVKTIDVEIADGKSAEVSFDYRGDEPPPPENKGELDGLF